MAGTAEVSEWIRHLADPDPAERFKSAHRLYRHALETFAPTLFEWQADSDFVRLLRCNLFSARPYPPGTVVVGVAVPPDHFGEIHMANGLPPLAEAPPDQDAKEFELLFGKLYALDILTTRDPAGDGAIARFLRKFGEGIQQIEVYVRDVDRATDILRTRFALQPIYPATKPGANGTRVNFFLVPASDGKKVLVELVQDNTKR